MALGDQLYVWREFANLEGVYQHHGIDTGDGGVIHYRKPSEIIELTSFETFSRGNPVYIREYPDGFCYIGDVVVNRAMSRLGENKYNLIFNNCEHFATWCKTGVNESKQINDFIPAIDKLNTYNLFEPLKQAFNSVENQSADTLINKALGDIRTVWDQLQPQYSNALQEVEAWNQVAWEALRKHRDDLAREALKHKHEYQKKANQLQAQLEKLATTTEGLLQSLNINNISK
jgi:hypothetical protein